MIPPDDVSELDFLHRFKIDTGEVAHLLMYTEGHANHAFCGRAFGENWCEPPDGERECKACRRAAERTYEARGEEWRRDVERITEGGPGFGLDRILPSGTVENRG